MNIPEMLSATKQTEHRPAAQTVSVKGGGKDGADFDAVHQNAGNADGNAVLHPDKGSAAFDLATAAAVEPVRVPAALPDIQATHAASLFQRQTDTSVAENVNEIANVGETGIPPVDPEAQPESAAAASVPSGDLNANRSKNPAPMIDTPASAAPELAAGPTVREAPQLPPNRHVPEKMQVPNAPAETAKPEMTAPAGPVERPQAKTTAPAAPDASPIPAGTLTGRPDGTPPTSMIGDEAVPPRTNERVLPELPTPRVDADFRSRAKLVPTAATTHIAPTPTMEVQLRELAVANDPVIGDAEEKLSLPLQQLARGEFALPAASVAAIARSPAQATAFAQHIAATLAKAPDGALEIRLDPPELGRLTLKLVVGDAVNTVSVSAERPEILDLMRRNESALHRELLEAGLTNLNLTFSQGSDLEQNDDPKDGATQIAASNSEVALTAVVPSSVNTVEGGLDIRL